MEEKINSRILKLPLYVTVFFYTKYNNSKGLGVQFTARHWFWWWQWKQWPPRLLASCDLSRVKSVTVTAFGAVLWGNWELGAWTLRHPQVKHNQTLGGFCRSSGCRGMTSGCTRKLLLLRLILGSAPSHNAAAHWTQNAAAADLSADLSPGIVHPCKMLVGGGAVARKKMPLKKKRTRRAFISLALSTAGSIL